MNIELRRIIDVNYDDFNSFLQLIDAFGNVRSSEPEAFLLAKLKKTWRQSIEKAPNSFTGSKVSLDLDSVVSFQAITSDAQIRLNSQSERLSIKLSKPESEDFWRKFQSQSQLQDVRKSGETFLSLYSFPSDSVLSVVDISDPLLTKLLTRISSYDGERMLEKLKGEAEFGPTEFGIRLSSAFNEEWRKKDERYVKFREIRSKLLSKKSWNNVSYLDFPELCDSIRSFDIESRNIIGIPSLAAVSYFQHNAEFTMQGNKLNLKGINKTTTDMLSLGNLEDCLYFLYILGCSIGVENVAAIKYRLSKDNFPVFNQNHLTRSDEIFDKNLFIINIKKDILPTTASDNLLENISDDSPTSSVKDLEEKVVESEIADPKIIDTHFNLQQTKDQIEDTFSLNEEKKKPVETELNKLQTENMDTDNSGQLDVPMKSKSNGGASVTKNRKK